ncbi:MAG: metal-dependent transcriptional regulator [Chloroflexota bacterium]
MDSGERHTANMEDYLEAIARLGGGDHKVRVTELSQALQVKKPSVSAALDRLAQEGLVRHERYGRVELTAEGQRAAADVWWRHEILARFLTEVLGMDTRIAQRDACKMEHVVSAETFDRLTKFVEFALTCPRGKPEWLDGFEYFADHGKLSEAQLARRQRGST